MLAPSARTHRFARPLPSRFPLFLALWLLLIPSVICTPPRVTRKTIQGSKSTFIATYEDSTIQPLRDSSERAFQKWANVFSSSVPVRVYVAYRPIAGGVLASVTQPYFVPGRFGAKLADDTVYGAAMAAALEGKDFVGERGYHAILVVNSRIEWWFEEGPAPFHKWDSETTLLHEAGHALFFGGILQAQPEKQVARFNSGGGKPAIFDNFLATADGGSVVACGEEGGEALYRAVTTEGLAFVDPERKGVSFGLFAPNPYDVGSSTYHLDDKTYLADCRRAGIPDSDCSDLLTPGMTNGYTQRNIGGQAKMVLESLMGSSRGVRGRKCQGDGGTGSSTGGKSKGRRGKRKGKRDKDVQKGGSKDSPGDGKGAVATDTPEPEVDDKNSTTPKADDDEDSAKASADEDASDDGGSACFPASAVVHRIDGQDVLMSDVRSGDVIRSAVTWQGAGRSAGDVTLAGEALHSAVFAFSHRQSAGLNRFVVLRTNLNHILTLSPGHYVHSNNRLIAADSVVPGDILETLDGRARVVHVSESWEQGLYAPHTLHGDVVVNRVRVSTYTRAVHPRVAHTLLAPFRFLVRAGLAKEPLGSLLYNGGEGWSLSWVLPKGSSNLIV